MHVLVVTVVHNPEDARIRYRQMRAIVDAGHQITYIAPFEHFGVPIPDGTDGVTGISVPRAQGRARIGALKAVRRAVRLHAPAADVVLMHDPELVLAVAKLRRMPPIVWDVHEDTAATMTLKPWMPRRIRPVGARVARFIERYAENHYHVILADEGYQHLFRDDYPVVPNTTFVPSDVPAPGDERVIHVGHLTKARGALEMIELGRLLGGSVRVELVGDADHVVAPALERAHADGHVVWHGFLPNDAAMQLVEGSLAGLSLRHDEPNYRHSWATKVIEYMARGIPWISTPTSPAPQIAARHEAGIVVPFDNPQAAADAVHLLLDDPDRRRAMARRGHNVALEQYNWPVHAKAFVDHIESLAR